MKLNLIAAVLAAIATCAIAAPAPPHRNALNRHRHPPQHPQAQPHHSPEAQSHHSAAHVDVVYLPPFAGHQDEHDHVARLHLVEYNENLGVIELAKEAGRHTGDHSHWQDIADKHREALHTAGDGHRAHRKAQSRPQRTQETSQIRADAQRAWESIMAARHTRFAANLAMRLAALRRQGGHRR